MKALRRVLIMLLFLGGPQAVAAGRYYFDYNPRCQQAYQHYMAFRIEEGDALIRQEFLAHPYNLMATYLADYGDCLLLLFNGDPEDLKQREGHQEERLLLLERAGDQDPWKRLSKAGIYMHWSLLHGRFGQNLKAASLFRKSYLLLRDNESRFPAFSPDDIFLGMEEALAGTIPDNYKWLISLLGVKGDVRSGVLRLSQYLDRHPSAAEPLRDEAVIYLQYLRFYLLSQQEPVWNFVNSEQFPVADNLLHAFIRANIALNYRKADLALQILRNAQSHPAYTRYPVFDFELANAMLFRLDMGCIYYYERFVRDNAGGLYTKDALEKIAWAWHLQGNRIKADAARKRILLAGSLLTDADKQAQRFAEEADWPHIILLQARLLTDGGHAAQALSRLIALPPVSLHSLADQLEHAFRLGKAYDQCGDILHAVQSYQRALSLGRTGKSQYGARSALQLALLYERGGQSKEAIQYFRICLSMKGHDFQSSIDQQAKAGLSRLTAGRP